MASEFIDPEHLISGGYTIPDKFLDIRVGWISEAPSDTDSDTG
ncbi:hypothetical protein [Oceanospirillum beijerinckii]|nr:hypothetical protein [Oceanospirillum beijerinckii]